MMTQGREPMIASAHNYLVYVHHDVIQNETQQAQKGVGSKSEKLEMKLFRIFTDFFHLCFLSEILLKNDRHWQFCCQN